MPERDKIAALLSRFAAEVNDPETRNRPLLNRSVRWTYWHDATDGDKTHLRADLLATGDPVGLVPSIPAARDGTWWTVSRTILFAWQVPHSVATMHELLMEKILA